MPIRQENGSGGASAIGFDASSISCHSANRESLAFREANTFMSPGALGVYSRVEQLTSTSDRPSESSNFNVPAFSFVEPIFDNRAYTSSTASEIDTKVPSKSGPFEGDSISSKFRRNTFANIDTTRHNFRFRRQHKLEFLRSIAPKESSFDKLIFNMCKRTLDRVNTIINMNSHGVKVSSIELFEVITQQTFDKRDTVKTPCKYTIGGSSAVGSDVLNLNPAGGTVLLKGHTERAKGVLQGVKLVDQQRQVNSVKEFVEVKQISSSMKSISSGNFGLHVSEKGSTLC